MNCFKPSTVACWIALAIPGVMALTFTFPLVSTAQDKTAKPVASDASKDLALQLEELRAKVAKLEAALDKKHHGTSSGMGGMGDKGMGMMGKGGMMDSMMGKGGMMDSMMGKGGMMSTMGGKQGQGMDGMQGQGMGGMGGGEMGQMMEMMKMMQMMQMMQMMEKMGTDKMGGMQGAGIHQKHSAGGMTSMSGMQASALPGFPGTSHVYHVGSTGFFLDHPEHITLTKDQEATLSRLKEKSSLEQATFQRKIEETEQELWALTGSDKPDAAKIEAKVREIEKLRGDQRMAFIRTVGEAAKVLTEEQRQVLLGLVEPKIDKPADHSKH